MANTVSVKNIAEQTDDKEIKDFFSFCGKISDIKVVPEGSTKSATVVFEKETAAKTALLLNNTKLGPNEISVTGSGSSG
jgi:RNA recognition motif-containing protein